MLIVGLMSGTSVDGIDAALVELAGVTQDGTLRWSVHACVCVPWESKLRQAILAACAPDTGVQQITALNYRLGESFSDAARQVIAQAGLTFSDIDAIASHGQTVWHQPTPYDIAGAGVTGTLQIGEPAVIAARTGCLVVSDFRAADIAVGGQGAPLVPFADYALFHSPHETRAVQNIGGIANVTLLPMGGTLKDVVAFDTGPGNMLIDALAVRLTDGAQTFDRDGALAAAGTVDRKILIDFLAHPYFRQPPPKSTGREQFGAAYSDRFLTAARKGNLSIADMLATATALTAESIACAYSNFLPSYMSNSTSGGGIKTVILGGGGLRNKTLVRMLVERLAPARVTDHQEFGLDSDAKEAVAFALLAYETLHGRPSNVPSATGANAPAILGKITLPPRNTGKLQIWLDNRL